MTSKGSRMLSCTNAGPLKFPHQTSAQHLKAVHQLSPAARNSRFPHINILGEGRRDREEETGIMEFHSNLVKQKAPLKTA